MISSTDRAHAAPAPTGLAASPWVPAVPRAARQVDLDRAKGLAILLVVFGHLVAREEPVGLTWYEPVRIGIYLFHMPFFMYLSGYAAFRFGGAAIPPAVWPSLVRRRALRLLLPFLTFGLLILTAKFVAARHFEVDNVPPDLWQGLRALVWDTAHSPATSIWYVGVLFIYAVATPLLLSASRGSLLLPVAVAGLLYLMAAPPLLYADRICRFYVFFVAGGLAARGGASWLAFVDRWRWPALAALLALAAFVGSGQVRFEWSESLTGGAYKWYMLAAGLLSAPALHGLARIRFSGMDGILMILGRNCFAIYLLNTLLIGATKAAMLTVLPWSAADFAGMAVILTIAATLGPILIKKHIFSKISVIDRMTD